jgi:hypothetical protein
MCVMVIHNLHYELLISFKWLLSNWQKYSKVKCKRINFSCIILDALKLKYTFWSYDKYLLVTSVPTFATNKYKLLCLNISFEPL